MTQSGKNKTVDDTKKFTELVAEKQGWKLHPDTEFYEILLEGLTKNANRYGYFSCPCREAEGIREKDKDIICPCHYCKPDQEEFGHCYCGLYLTEEFFKTGKMPESIPERKAY